MLGLGKLRQLRGRDACAHTDLVESEDTIMRVAVRKQTSGTITIAYRWREMVCCIVIGCVDVSWVLHFILHNHRLRDSLPIDALLVTTSSRRVLKHDAHG